VSLLNVSGGDFSSTTRWQGNASRGRWAQIIQTKEVLQLAKNRMTFEKQLRETKKRQKAAAKRESRRRQKDEPQAKSESVDINAEESHLDGTDPPN
jgi:ribosomal protein S21